VYARAIIKKRSGEHFAVEAKVKCDIVGPTNILDTGARLKHAFHSNRLLWEFYRKVKPYANQDHALVRIETDNLWLLNKLADEGYTAEFLPDFQDEGDEPGENSGD
jgi:hypothetical protein